MLKGILLKWLQNSSSYLGIPSVYSTIWNKKKKNCLEMVENTLRHFLFIRKQESINKLLFILILNWNFLVMLSILSIFYTLTSFSKKLCMYKKYTIHTLEILYRSRGIDWCHGKFFWCISNFINSYFLFNFTKFHIMLLWNKETTK